MNKKLTNLFKVFKKIYLVELIKGKGKALVQRENNRLPVYDVKSFNNP